MFSSLDDLFLSPTAEQWATDALVKLEQAGSSTEAVANCISVEDTIGSMQASGEISEADAKRLYMIFEMMLELRLKKFSPE
jgi:hypothetical protein